MSWNKIILALLCVGLFFTWREGIATELLLRRVVANPGTLNAEILSLETVKDGQLAHYTFVIDGAAYQGTGNIVEPQHDIAIAYNRANPADNCAMPIENRLGENHARLFLRNFALLFMPLFVTLNARRRKGDSP